MSYGASKPGLERAREEMTEMSGRRPSKPWRVDGPADNGNGATFASQPGAYAEVRELNGYGHTAVVWHWEDGDWRLYERFEPDTEPDRESPLEAIKRGRMQVLDHERRQR